MSKWRNLVSTVKERNYKDALKQLNAVQNYDDLQDALQVIPFHSLNQDLPAGLELLANLYTKFMSLATDKEEGRLIIGHVFKASILLKNFVRVHAENLLIGENDLKYIDFIDEIMQVTSAMDKGLVDELITFHVKLKSSLEHYLNRKTLLMDYSYGIEDVKIKLRSCLSKYRSFVIHLESITNVGVRRNITRKGHTMMYKDVYDSPRKNTRHSPCRLSQPRSLIREPTSHRGTVEQLRKGTMFSQAVLDVVEPWKDDIERGPRLLQNLRRLIESDNKFLEVISELSTHIASPSFANARLENIVAHFINSYDRLLSGIAPQNEPYQDQQYAIQNTIISVQKKEEVSVEKNREITFEISAQKDAGIPVRNTPEDSVKKKDESRIQNDGEASVKKDVKISEKDVGMYCKKDPGFSATTRAEIPMKNNVGLFFENVGGTSLQKGMGTGLVNRGLKIDFTTTSSAFRRRIDAIRPVSVSNSEDTSTGPVTNRHDNEGDELSKLQEKLSMKDKQLAETGILLKKLKKREEQLLEKLTIQANHLLMRSEKFENVSCEFPRTEQLIKKYDDLYSQLRLDAMDDLDKIESLNCLEKSDEIKSQISFAIMTVSFQLAQQELETKQRKIYFLLGVDMKKLENGDYVSLSNEILRQLRRSSAQMDLQHLVDEVMEGLFSTLFDFPELRSCEELRHFTEACVRFSCNASMHAPPLVISYEASRFTSSIHSKSCNSNTDWDTIRYHVWPTLLDSQSRTVLFKGIVNT